MLALTRVRTDKVYRNCLKSMPKCNTIVECPMSSNSENIDEVLNLMKKKATPKAQKVKKLQMKMANRLFDLMKGDDNLKKPEAVEKEPVVDVTSNMNELMKTAETIPTDSGKSLKVSTVPSTLRTILKNKNDPKQKFLQSAKQVAVTLGVDVKITQTELLKAYESVEGIFPDAGEKFQSSQNFRSKKLLAEKSRESGIQYQQFPSVFDMKSSALNIFTKNVGERETRPMLETWNELKKITLLHSSSRPPRNYFEELINWTNQGKLWRFPIDNDQDWHEEIATNFTEHVFLDKHLEPWCPRSGPIRHFMELVTTGLSKNPYLSVEKKKTHILWYRDYFQAKSALLAELGVLDSKVNADAERLEAGENKS